MKTPSLKMKSPLACKVIVAAVVGLVVASPAYAQQQPEIVKAELNLDTHVAAVSGRNFGSATGRVALVGSKGTVLAELAIASWTSESVLAYLPPSLPEATFRLALATAGGGSKSDVIDVTVVSKIVGPMGPAGPQGPAGPEGPAGPQGLAGPQGPAGAAGPAGPAGPIGPAGPAGATGPAGPAGPAGATGPQGAMGPQGATGPQGPAGPQGVAGPQGPAGPIGPIGPAGADGAAGQPGPAGAGFVWRGAYDANHEYSAGDVVAYNGTSFITTVTTFGTEPPAAPWQILAAAGQQGAAGETGAQGPAGPKGDDGAQGPSGTQGPAGPAGPAGPQGPTGGQGPIGPIGPAGPAGPTGPQGPAGAGVGTLGSAMATLTTQALNSASFTTIPSTVSIDVPSTVTEAVAMIIAEGEVSSSAVAFSQAIVEFHLVVDTTTVRVQRVAPPNVGGANMPAQWRLSAVQTLAAGTHTIKVEAKTTFISGGTATANAAAIAPGALSVVLLSK